MRLIRALATVFAAATLTLTGCASGTDSVVYGGSFTFVSPGGKFEFTYPEAERQTIGDFTGSSLTDANTTISLSDYPGQPIVLNFWGSWCGPCLEEAPDLNVAAELTADDGVQFLGINVKDSRSSGADWTAAQGVTYPSIFDPTQRTLLSLKGLPTGSIPITIILDKEHRVANIFLRKVSAQEVDVAATALAAEGQPTEGRPSQGTPIDAQPAAEPPTSTATS